MAQVTTEIPFEITDALLEKHGWKRTPEKDPIATHEKDLGWESEDPEELEEAPALVLTMMRNALEFALIMDGCILYLAPKSMDELDALAEMITSYE